MVNNNKQELPIQIQLPNNFLDEEIRNGYVVTTKIKEIWAVELDLLACFDSICKKYDILYYACGGTMLGAVRHKGFIPWDNDIDVMMFRDEYKKFLKYACKELSAPYFLQIEESDRGSVRGHAQLRNSKTTAILKGEEKCNLDINQGIFIDIFVMDNIPDCQKKRKRFLSKVIKKRERFRKIKYITSHYNINDDEGIKKIVKKILHILIYPVYRVSRKNWAYENFEKFIQKYENDITETVGILLLYDKRERFVWNKKDIVQSVNFNQFEFMKIPVPSNYGKLLSKTYGNWSVFDKNAAVHGDIIFDTHNSYTQYCIRE